MLISIAQLVGGFLLLVWAADRLVAGASATARNLGVAPLIIGLTIVGFGTSAPELVVAAVATYRDNAGLALGNAIGSNIANLGMVLGLTALIYPLHLESAVLKREYPLLLLIMLLCLFLFLDLHLSHLEGWIMLGGLAVLILWLIRLGLQKSPRDPLVQELEAEIPTGVPTRVAVFWLSVGLVVLPISSQFLVEGAVSIAHVLGVTDAVIGLTIVALGTSMPELATAITSALRHEHDLAIGNIIGSNMFNMLGVFGIAAVIRPMDVPPILVARDFPVMFLMTGLLFILATNFRGPGRIGRRAGLFMLSLFVVYQIIVWMGIPESLSSA